MTLGLSLRTLGAAVLALPLFLSGCALQYTASPSAGEPVALTGHIHGGQSPVAGARIYLIGYGYGDIVTPYGPGGPNGVDGIGDYVVSDADGNFSLTSNYTCTAGNPVYLLARGGNPGLGSGKSNPALALMTVLGICPATGSFPSSMFVDVSEVSTVAAVYSLAGYLTGPSTYYYSNSERSNAAMVSAVAEALAIVPANRGSALTATASGGIVPLQKLNLLANIIASCINSDGSTSTIIGGVTTLTPCGNLFANATADGTPTGTQPFDTVTALLNIAHHPGASPAGLFPIASPQGPFQPALGTQPNDFALALTFPLSASGFAFTPNQIAVDAFNNVYLPGTLSNGVTALLRKDALGNDGPSKIDLSGTVGTTPYSVTSVNQVALDSANQVWYGTDSTPGGFLGQLLPSDTGYAQTGHTGGGFTGQTHGIFVFSSIDNSFSVFVPDYTARDVAIFNFYGAPEFSGFAAGSAWNGVVENQNNRLFLVTTASNTVTTDSIDILGRETLGSVSGGGLNQPNSLAVDSTQSIWVTNNNNSLSKFTTGSVAASPANGFTGGGLNFDPATYSTVPVVVDGANGVWVPNYAGQSISAFTTGGVPISPSTGYATGCASKGVAIDQIGNVWVSCQNNTLLEFIGAATPVTTPIASGYTGLRP